MEQLSLPDSVEFHSLASFKRTIKLVDFSEFLTVHTCPAAVVDAI